MIKYSCNNWTFYPLNQEIVYDTGEIKQLPTRLSVCLKTLIESKGHTVTYDELLNKVWGTTHKDSSTISSVISELRKIIGCGKDNLKLLHTVPKRGYRFVGEVTVESTPLQNESESEVLTETSTLVTAKVEVGQEGVKTQSRQDGHDTSVIVNVRLPNQLKDLIYRYRLILLILVAVIITISVAIMTAGPERLIQPVELNVSPMMEQEIITHEQGREMEFDISHDNQWVVYSQKSDDQDHQQIIVKNLTNGLVRVMPGDGISDYRSPSFSPNADRIAYIKNTPQACEVWLIQFNNTDLDMASNRQLSRCGLAGYWTTTDFSSDGQSLYFSRSEGLTDPFRVYRHNLQTGYERNLTAPSSSGRGDYAFSVSPDGTQLAIVRNKLWQGTVILIKDLKTDSIRVIEELPYLLERIAWYNDNQLVYRGDNWQLYLRDINSNQSKVLADIGQPFAFPVVNNGRLFVYRGMLAKGSIWSLNINESQHSELHQSIRSPYSDFAPTFAGGEGIYFMSNRSSVNQLWYHNKGHFVKISNESFPSQVKDLHYNAERQALYGISASRLFRYDLQQKVVTYLTAESILVRNLSLSDTGSLLFATESNEHWRLHSMDLDSAEITDLNINGFTAHQQNGYVYFTRYREVGLWQYDIRNATESKIIDDFDALMARNWAILGNNVFLIHKRMLLTYVLDTRLKIENPMPFKGNVKNIECSQQAKRCLLDIFEADETEIIELK